jgi:DNA-directed RNA polymerase subunit RPC12/RpoP
VKRLLIALLGIGCTHAAVRWPRRAEDGLDYLTCPECGHRMLSKIQFAQRETHQRIIYQSPKIDEVSLAA